MNDLSLDLDPQSLGMVCTILAREAPGVEVLAFGSRVQGRALPFSDLDLALRSRGDIDVGVLSRLQEAFEESDLPIFVDVLDLARVSDTFRKRIEANHKVLVAAKTH